MPILKMRARTIPTERRNFTARNMLYLPDKRLRARPGRASRVIGAPDLITAATAVSLGWDVVTANIKEFRQVEELKAREL
jgi:predicted nucleic acid-binding protein